MNNLQNESVLAIDCQIEDGNLNCGLVVVNARTTSPQLIVDEDTGLKYSIQLPEELEYQGLIASLDNVRMPILGFD
jgi:uncharacterized UPF0146 family protein